MDDAADKELCDHPTATLAASQPCPPHCSAAAALVHPDLTIPVALHSALWLPCCLPVPTRTILSSHHPSHTSLHHPPYTTLAQLLTRRTPNVVCEKQRPPTVCGRMQPRKVHSHTQLDLCEIARSIEA